MMRWNVFYRKRRCHSRCAGSFDCNTDDEAWERAKKEFSGILNDSEIVEFYVAIADPSQYRTVGLMVNGSSRHKPRPRKGETDDE